MPNDEIMIDRLSAANDRWWSEHSFGGMYDTTYYPDPWAKEPKKLVLGVTDRCWNLLEEGGAE
jgi:hypothetical protein